ncbi:MAG: helix-turn-helix transcriptional regulator [Oscillospiraceae bacterium]|nr:helix-turn-helix transcriptional regulator [Oscillospiraceae bacterium]
MEFGEMGLSEYGVFDSRVKFPRGVVTEPRQVDCYEVELYTEDQSGCCYVEGTEVPLRKGTLICARPGMIRNSRLPFRCLYFHLHTQDPHLCTLLERLPMVCMLTDMSAAVSLFRRLIALDHGLFQEERLLVQSCTLELLYRLIQDAGYPQRDVRHTHRRIMQWAEQFIRENPAAELDLNALAQRSNLSPSYFHKLFTEHFGITPAEYVLSCRISAAKTMLVEGELPIEEIAARSGFSSRSYFSFCFKQRTGKTPLEYRKDKLSRLLV